MKLVYKKYERPNGYKEFISRYIVLPQNFIRVCLICRLDNIPRDKAVFSKIHLGRNAKRERFVKRRDLTVPPTTATSDPTTSCFRQKRCKNFYNRNYYLTA